MDEKKTFLNVEIEKEVYIEKSVGFMIHEKESHACRSKKAMYGLIQAPRAWYMRIDGYGLRYVSSIDARLQEYVEFNEARRTVEHL